MSESNGAACVAAQPRLVDGTKIALSALFHLSDAGIAARRVEVGDGVPCIEIDPPPQSAQVRIGASMHTQHEAGARRRIMVARAYGCRIEWEIGRG